MGFEVLWQDGFYNDFKNEKLKIEDFDNIELILKDLSKQKNPLYNTKRLKSSKELIYYFKYKPFSNKEYRIFVYFNFENETINIIGIQKRNQNNSYKKNTIKQLNKRVKLISK